MKRTFKNSICFPVFFIFCSQLVYSQQNTVADTVYKSKAVEVGAKYRRSSFYQWLMGKNYRKEWTTPVKVPVILLDTAKGGLIPYKAGGGHQTKALHVKTAAEKEYAFRSVDKSLDKVLPEILHNTFIVDIVNDEVSMSHPYGAGAVPMMAQKAEIYHTLPQFVYLPNQRLLDTFNSNYGNKLYLFEQRLSGNWKEAANLGNFDKFINTYKLIDTLLENNSYHVDQRLFIKCRLFDIFIGDWDRHEDQWGWGLRKIEGTKTYLPIPHDRDQAFFKYDGKLLKLLISAAGLKYFQAFNGTLPDVRTFNYEERNLDRFFANQMTLRDWQNVAKDLQQSLNDEVIAASVKQLPPEIFAISGNEIIEKLKLRRNHLQEYAATYYKFIAKEVEIVGSKEAETFEVNRINNTETGVKVYRFTNQQKEQDPYYSRIFRTGETKEIRLYGLSGKDIYSINGDVGQGINIRIIGGDEKDSIIDRSVVRSGKSKTQVYDDYDNVFVTSQATRLHLSSDTSIHSYNYFNYLYDKKGIGPTIFYNYDDRLYAGINVTIIHHKWRERPFAYRQQLGLNYSISQHAFSVTYNSLYPNAIRKSDLLLKGSYDAIRWTKFFGLGNETPLRSNYNDFYRMQSEEWLASIGLRRRFLHNDISVSTFFQSVRVINDQGRFVPKVFAPSSPDVAVNNFTGAKINYIFDKVNDSIIPTKGVTFSGSGTYSHSLSQQAKDFARYYGSVQLYVPLLSSLSLSVKSAVLTVVGNPLFYQYVSIGGPETMRGYRLDRFWGRTGFYNANELRYITDIKSYIFNGKAGLLALFDNGRVWMPGERSDTWHSAYGGGLLLAPFNKVQIVVTYAISNEMKLFQLRVGRSF